MKRTRILAALLAAIVMLIMAIAVLPQQSDSGKEKEKTKKILVATVEIPADTVITEDMLGYAEFSENIIPESAIERVEDAVGNITRNKIVPKEMVTFNDLLVVGDKASGLAMVLGKGMRAISIQVDEVSGTGYLLKVGSHVDVITVLNDENEGYYSKMLLQNIEVAALNTALAGAPVDANGVPNYTTVTLAVRPQDAVNLVLAFHEGSVYLIQRPQDDEKKVDTQKMKVRDLLQ